MKDVRRAIYEASGRGARSIIQAQASRYMDLILETEGLSPEHGIPQPNFDLLIEILSIDDLHEKPGMEDFMAGMATDTGWLSAEQKGLMYDAMFLNYKRYAREDFCWTVCDFVARQFSFDKAFAFFEGVIGSATEEGRRGVYLGLDILYRQARKDTYKEARITSLIKANQGR